MRGGDVSARGAASCAHGYPTATACPRCGVVTRELRPRPTRTTRWHATPTTLGPRVKVSLTVVLLLPVLVCLLGLVNARHHLGNAFLVIPLWAFGLVAAMVLYYLWEPGQRGPSSS